MKRSYDNSSESSDTSNEKRIRYTGSIDGFEESLESSSDESIIQNSVHISEQEDNFSTVEKQIINKALSMVNKTDPHDWNYGLNLDNFISMDLFGKVLTIDENNNECIYKISTTVFYEENMTGIKIEALSNRYIKSFHLIWRTDSNDNRLCIIRDVNNWWFWTRKEKFFLFPEDIQEHSWCYFQDVRDHLSHIDIFF